MQRRTLLKLSALSLGMLASGMALAGARLGDDLTRRLNTAAPTDRLEVVITYKQDQAPTATQIQALEALGIDDGIAMHELPIVGALATPAQIQALADRDDVSGIHYNRTLRYYNADARQMTGVDTLQADPDLGFTGLGVTVMVNDSGIDATHPDLPFGSHIVQNVQALTNLGSIIGIGQATYLEDQIDTDISSGHGTHCAGIVGGTGEARADLYRRGVATGADIVGYGSGAVISILDAVGGFDYAIENQDAFNSPIRVISNSWGTTGAFDSTDPVNVASYEAYKHDIVSVFAAGNDGPDANTHNPYAQAPWVISVGAANKDGTLADFSSRGNPGESGNFTMADGMEWTYVNQPTIVAPGVDIVSDRAKTGALPVLAATADASLGEDAVYYTIMSGTSMATPHVAGIVALLLQANPSLTPLAVKQAIEDTAIPMPGRSPYEVGSGFIDAYQAARTVAQ